MPMKIVIILPTYNEKDNIRLLVPALWQQFAEIKHEMHVLVVDDHSPDGTADAVRELMATYANLHLLTGEKAGSGRRLYPGDDLRPARTPGRGGHGDGRRFLP